MDEPEEESSLMMMAERVCRAIEAHARACLDDATDVAAITGAGEVLVTAVREYERRLLKDTGWSNPVRHLGRLPAYSGDDNLDLGSGIDSSEAVVVSVAARYILQINDEELLANLVEGRGGDRPQNSEEAVRFLFECDSWDVWQYPPSMLRLLDTNVEISDRD